MRDVILTDFRQKQPWKGLAERTQRIMQEVRMGGQHREQPVRMFGHADRLIQNFRFVTFVSVVRGPFPAKLAG
jgi:hypothetical protein